MNKKVDLQTASIVATMNTKRHKEMKTMMEAEGGLGGQQDPIGYIAPSRVSKADLLCVTKLLLLDVATKQNSGALKHNEAINKASRTSKQELFVRAQTRFFFFGTMSTLAGGDGTRANVSVGHMHLMEIPQSVGKPGGIFWRYSQRTASPTKVVGLSSSELSETRSRGSA